MTDNDETLEVKMIDDVKPLMKPKLPTDTIMEIGEAPEDHGNKVYYSFMYLGFCSLMPWSAVLNTFDFFIYKVSFRKSSPYQTP